MKIEKEAESLQKRVSGLERQLAEANTILLALKANAENRKPSLPYEIMDGLLFSSEEGFRHALLAIPYPLMIWREDGRILMVNDAFTQISGYGLEDIPTHEEWLRRAFGERIVQHPAVMFYENFPGQDVKKTREFQITTLSGEQRIWDFSDTVLGTDPENRWLMLTMAVDITERREIEQQLEENEEKLSITFDKAPYASALSKLPEGIITHVNEEFERVFGYTRLEVLGRTSLELGINPDAGTRARILAQIQAQGKARNVETQLITKSGETRVFLLNLDQVSIGGEKYVLQTAQDVTTRKQAEETLNEMTHQLAQDRTRLTTILENLPVGVWISDEQGRLISKNEQADRIWAGNAPLLQNIDEYQQYQSWHADSGLPVLQEEFPIIRVLRTGQPVEPVEHKIRRFDGSEGTVLVSAAPIRDEQGSLTGVVAVNVDISERKQAEDALRNSEERFSKAFHKSPFGMNITRWADGVILDTNDAWLDLLGWTREEVINKTTADFPFYARAEDRERVRERIKREEVSGDLEINLVRKDGSRLVVTVGTTLIELQGERCILGVLNDITARKNAEEALRESEERYRAVMENALDAIIVADPSDGGKVLSANSAALRMFGYSREEFVGLAREDIIDMNDPRLATFLKQRENNGESTGELTYKRRDRSRFAGELSAVFYRDQNGNQRSIAIIRDVTERRQADVALRESEQRYRGLFEAMQEGLIAGEVITSDSGIPIDYRYIDVNPAIERQYGIPRESFIGRTYTEVLPEGDPEWINVLGDVALTGIPMSVERYSQESGKWFEAHAYSPRPGQFINILTDITERKRAEEALRKSEERFAKAFRSSPDAIIISRMADGLIIEVNEGWSELFGHAPGEVVGRRSLDLNLFANPDDRRKVVQRIQELGAVRNYEIEIRRNSGEVRLASLSAEIIEVNGEAALLTSLRDVTERKQMEEALRASEAKMRAVFRALTEGVVFMNRQGEIEEANDAVQLTFGHTLQELSDPELDPRTRIIRTDGTLFPVEEQPGLVALRTGETVRDVEMGVPVKGGKISWRLVNAQPVLDDQGTLQGAVVSFFDITERKQVEQALRESEARFRSLANSMPQLVWTALPDGRVDYYNERYLEYQDIKQVSGNDWEWAPVLHPADVQATVNAWLHSLESGDVYQIEHRVRMSNGSYRWHLSRGIPMHDEQGRILRWFGTATDIHDLKLAQEQLISYADRLERSNRELEQFAFMASHDLQEPLRKIEMFGDLLLERATSLQENERNYLDRMRNAAGRMRDMIEGLLQLSRVATQGKPFVQVDLNQVMADVLSDFEETIQRSSASVEYPSLPAVTGDPSQLRQLMQNLIGNALKYSRPGSPPQVKVQAIHSDERVQIIVQDQGIGFDQEDAERIFQPFQRLVGRSQYEGSGIGLAICRRIVERHGGEIAAISESGYGTTFIITLPVHLPRKDIGG